MRNTGMTSVPSVKFGCLKDDKFCEKMTDYILFKNLDGKYMTLPDWSGSQQRLIRTKRKKATALLMKTAKR